MKVGGCLMGLKEFCGGVCWIEGESGVFVFVFLGLVVFDVFLVVGFGSVVIYVLELVFLVLGFEVVGFVLLSVG